MTRDIRFRAKRDNGEFVYGYYVAYMVTGGGKLYHHIKNSNDTYAIDENTLGQFTGLKDKNGSELFEGDIITFGNKNNVVIVFGNGCFSVFGEPLGWDFDTENKPVLTDFKYCEKLGNIHQNPELLTNK